MERPNLKICIENDLDTDSDDDKPVIEELEEEEESESEKSSDDHSSEAGGSPTEPTRPPTWPEPKRYQNTEEEFITGFNSLSEEELQKKTERAKRFGFGLDKSVSEGELTSLYESVGVDPEDSTLRLEAIHISGVDDMSTKNVFEFFRVFTPSCLEWINDSTCNVVWLDQTTAARALLVLSREVTACEREKGVIGGSTAAAEGERRRELSSQEHPRDTEKDQASDRGSHGDQASDRGSHGDQASGRGSHGDQASDHGSHGDQASDHGSHGDQASDRSSHGDQASDHDSEGGDNMETGSGKASRTDMSKTNKDEEFDYELNLMSEDEESEEKTNTEKKPSSEEVPSQNEAPSQKGSDLQKQSQDEAMDTGGRGDVMVTPPIDIPTGCWRVAVHRRKSLFMRYATSEDKKQTGAEQKSNYYRKYGNPNYQGMKGIISQSRRRRLKAVQYSKEEELAKKVVAEICGASLSSGLDRGRSRLHGNTLAQDAEDELAAMLGAGSSSPHSEEDLDDSLRRSPVELSESSWLRQESPAELSESSWRRRESPAELSESLLRRLRSPVEPVDDFAVEEDVEEELRTLLTDPSETPSKKRSMRMYADDLEHDLKAQSGGFTISNVHERLTDVRNQLLDARSKISASAEAPRRAAGDLRDRLARKRQGTDMGTGRGFTSLPSLTIQVEPD